MRRRTEGVEVRTRNTCEAERGHREPGSVPPSFTTGPSPRLTTSPEKDEDGELEDAASAAGAEAVQVRKERRGIFAVGA